MSSQTRNAAGPVIRVRDLRKSYGDLKAVDGVSFEVQPGQVFGLLGPNGAGKTTTVEVLEGLRAPDSGDVSVLGVDAVRRPDDLKARIGVSLQTAALYPKLTVVEVLDLFRSFYPSGRPTDELVALMDLGEKRATRTQDLSGGQRQRLSVALALVNDPELVFLDEPTTGMDPAARRMLWDVVLGLKASGRSVLLTTHYMEEAEVLCDRLAIMDHGVDSTSGRSGSTPSSASTTPAWVASPGSRPSSTRMDRSCCSRVTSRRRSARSSPRLTRSASSRPTSPSDGRRSKTSSST